MMLIEAVLEQLISLNLLSLSISNILQMIEINLLQSTRLLNMTADKNETSLPTKYNIILNVWYRFYLINEIFLVENEVNRDILSE
jgi:hypothetical protein